jgi:hypothetical protein
MSDLGGDLRPTRLYAGPRKLIYFDKGFIVNVPVGVNLTDFQLVKAWILSADNLLLIEKAWIFGDWS